MKSGVYIHLFHGRKDSSRPMDEMGDMGPIFGPYEYAHTTYGSDIKLGEKDVLFAIDDLVYYNGMWYGDWSVFSNPEVVEKLDYLLENFDQSLADLPKNINLCSK